MQDTESINVTIVGHGPMEFPRGTALYEVAEKCSGYYERPILAAIVNNDLQELSRKLRDDSTVEFLTVADRNGYRVYQRTAAFLMFYAVKTVLGVETRVVIEHSINKNYYCTIRGWEDKLTDELLAEIEGVMKQAAEQGLKIEKHTFQLDEAIKTAEEMGLHDKVKVLRYRRTSNVNFYKLGWFYDYFYGHLAPSAGHIKLFALKKADDGFILHLPRQSSPDELSEITNRLKISRVLQESNHWASILKVDTVGALNDIISSNGYSAFVRINEALHEKRIAAIADRINDGGAKLVLIAGPSSSGKTTFAERLSLQLRVCGLRPHVISLDDYYFDRDDVPRDEYGQPDFETIDAIDTEQINKDLARLVAGERVEMPAFNFTSGKREYKGRYLSLAPDDILVIEGIHGLNGRTTEIIPKELKFKIVISALTQLNIDDHNRISTSDTRLIRRIVRDSKYRGFHAQETIAMWPSVLRGEERFIFPFQDEADEIFNSALVYELCALKSYIEPILFGIGSESREYTDAKRLIKFLDMFIGIPSEDIPPNSILREFIGGSCFRT